MKALLKNKFECYLAALFVFTSISIVFSFFIKLTLARTDSKTEFISIFLLIFGIFFIAITLMILVASFRSFKEIYVLSRRWNISMKDIAEGIYTHQIEYSELDATLFLNELKKAQYEKKIYR